MQEGSGLMSHLLQLRRRFGLVMKLVQNRDHMALCCKDIVLALHAEPRIYRHSLTALTAIDFVAIAGDVHVL